MWDISSRQIKHQFTGHEQDIYSLDFARNGKIIASGSGDRSVRLWDLERNDQVANFSIEDGVTTVAISPDNRFVAAGSLDKSVRVWDIQSGQLVVKLEGEQGHKDSVYSVAFAPSGDRLVSGSLDKTIKMWELTTNNRFMSTHAAPSGKCIRTFEGHKDFVLSVALTPHGDWVLSGSKDRGVQFWDPHTGVAQLMLQGHKNSGMWPQNLGASFVMLQCKHRLIRPQSSPWLPAQLAESSPQAVATCVRVSGGTYPLYKALSKLLIANPTSRL